MKMEVQVQCEWLFTDHDFRGSIFPMQGWTACSLVRRRTRALSPSISEVG